MSPRGAWYGSIIFYTIPSISASTTALQVISTDKIESSICTYPTMLILQEVAGQLVADS